MDKNNFIDIGKDVFNVAIKELPEIDYNELINDILSILLNREDFQNIAMKYADRYQQPLQNFVDVFARVALCKGFEQFQGENSFNANELADNLVDGIEEIGSIILKNFDGEIDIYELINRLQNGIVSIANSVKLSLNSIYSLATNMTFIYSTVSYASFFGAYLVYKKCLDDSNLQYEHRLVVEKECQESIKAICRYRNELKKVIDEYFSSYYDTLHDSFALVDKKLIENDINGYIMGNVELQKLLDYDFQFENADEFEDLMSSDVPFKL